MKCKARDWIVTFWPDEKDIQKHIENCDDAAESEHMKDNIVIQSPESCISPFKFHKFIEAPPLSFCCFQLEKCPKSGRIHGQMYLEFSSVRTMGYVIELLKETISVKHPYVAVRKGTQQQAIDYCTKQETRLEWFKPFVMGTPKHQGARSDLTNMLDMIICGASKVEILSAMGGNALRHLGMIDRAQKAIYGMDTADNALMEARRKAEESGEEFQIGVNVITYTKPTNKLHEYHSKIVQQAVAEITDNNEMEREGAAAAAKYGKLTITKDKGEDGDVKDVDKEEEEDSSNDTAGSCSS